MAAGNDVTELNREGKTDAGAPLAVCIVRQSYPTLHRSSIRGEGIAGRGESRNPKPVFGILVAQYHRELENTTSAHNRQHLTG
jgi:hypothetical protein